MKKYALLVSVLALMVAAVSANASLNIYGASGLIETPDDTVVAPSSVDLNVNYVSDVANTDESLTSYVGAIGLFPKFEVGVAGVDYLDNTDYSINGKYRLADETLSTPSITVGVVDLTSELRDDPSFYVVLGKDITSMAEGVSGSVSKPLRGYVGVGSDIYKGVFAGLNWSLTNELDVQAEYLADGLADGGLNAGLQWKSAKGLFVKAGTIDFDSIYVGASYNVSTY